MKKFAVLCTVFLFGCSTITSPEIFKEKKASLSDSELCRTLIKASDTGNTILYSDALTETFDRGLTYAKCKDRVTAQNNLIAAITAGTIAGIVASSNNGSGYVPPTTPQDFQWAWDEFYNEYRQLVWRCRGMQTGQFAPDDKCMLKMKLDNTWPAKENF